MTYRGHIENGAVVFDEPVDLPEGTLVEVNFLELPSQPGEEVPPTLAEALAPFIGKATGLPEDAAENHDHYIHETPRK